MKRSLVMASCAKTPPKSDHPTISGSTQSEEVLGLRKLGPIDAA